MLLVLSLALAVQALLIGAHRHEQTGRSLPAAAAPVAGQHEGHGCAICEMQRVGGNYLPAVAALVVLAGAAAWRVGASAGKPLPRIRAAMGWRSRAPPLAESNFSA
jgi:hypothetical protein